MAEFSDVLRDLVLVGGPIAGAVANSWLNGRQEERRWQREEDRRDADLQATERAARWAFERETLLAIAGKLPNYVSPAPNILESAQALHQSEIEVLALRVADEKLHQLIWDGSGHALVERVGYLLRTPPGERTPDGHVQPPQGDAGP